MNFISVTPNEFEGVQFDIKEEEVKEYARWQIKYENVTLETITIEDCETMRELIYVMNMVNK